VSRPVIVGLDPRRPDWAPVDFGVEAARIVNARLLVAVVQAGGPEPPLTAGQMVAFAAAQVDPDLEPDCRAIVAEVEAKLHAESVQGECVRLRGTSAARALQDVSERDDAILLVVGARRRRGPLGSTAAALVHGSPCPVAVVPRGWEARRQLREIGVGYVDTPEARAALRAAHALAVRVGATLRVISVVSETPTMYQFGTDLEDVVGGPKVWTERHLRGVVAELGDVVPVTIDVPVGEPALMLVEISRRLDLLTMGARGYGPLRAVLAGSVSRQVTAGAHCPVVVLPRGVELATEALMTDARSATSVQASA